MNWLEGRLVYVSDNFYVKSIEGEPVGFKTGLPTQGEIDNVKKHLCVKSIRWEDHERERDK